MNRSIVTSAWLLGLLLLLGAAGCNPGYSAPLSAEIVSGVTQAVANN